MNMKKIKQFKGQTKRIKSVRKKITGFIIFGNCDRVHMKDFKIL